MSFCADKVQMLQCDGKISATVRAKKIEKNATVIFRLEPILPITTVSRARMGFGPEQGAMESLRYTFTSEHISTL